MKTLAAALAATLIVLLAAVGLVPPGATPADAAGDCSGRHWVGSWAAAPAAITAPGELGSPRPLADQTLRMVVTPTLSGRTARIRLSHRYGDEPVTFSSVTVARRATGADAAPRTMRRLRSDHTEARRRQVNRWIRRQRIADSVIDFDRAVRDPGDPRRLRPRYDSGDRLHPSSAGYRAMAEAVDTSVLLRGGCR